MLHRLTMVSLALFSFTVMACLLLGGQIASVLFVVTGIGFIPSLIFLGASRRGRIGSLGIPVALLTVLLLCCCIGMLLLSGRSGSDDWWLGLPPSAALMLYGLWLSPLLLVSLVFAWHYERFGLRPDDLRRIRELSRSKDREDR